MYIIIVSDHVLLLSLLHSSWIKAIVKELRSQIVRMLYLRDQVPDTLGHFTTQREMLGVMLHTVFLSRRLGRGRTQYLPVLKISFSCSSMNCL